MDAFTLSLVTAAINGATLFAGIFIGIQLTERQIEKKLLKMAKKSTLLQRLTDLVEKLNTIVDQVDMEQLLGTVKEVNKRQSIPLIQLPSKPEVKKD